MSANISVKKLIELWGELADVPVTEDGEFLDGPFLHFEKGADVHTVWHWFEDQNVNFCIGHLQNGHVVHVVGYDSNTSGGFDWYFKKEDADVAFEKEKAAVASFSDEGYTAYRFDAIVSTLDENTSVKEIDGCLDDLFISADRVEGCNPRYKDLRKKCKYLAAE
ncbi:MAG: hypothetical protein QM500_17445 [Methylococcales bacterium]